MALFKKGGHSCGIASSTVIFLLSRNEDLSLKNIKTTPKWNVVSSKDLDFGSKLQQPEKWKSLKEQEKSIIFELLTLEQNNIPIFQSPFCLIVTRYHQSMLLLVVLQWHQKIQLVLVWLEVPTSVALHWLWLSHSMEKYYHSYLVYNGFLKITAT